MMRKAILPAIAICCVFSICALSTGASWGFKITTIEDLNHRSGRLGVYKALVIGIDDYANPEIANLKTAVNDANTIAMVLKEKYGFNVQLLKELKQNAKPYVSIQEIYTRIAPIISNNSEQTPICRPIRNTGDQGGEFVFVAAVKEKLTHHDTKPRKVNMEMDLAFWQSIQNSDNPALYEAYIQKFPNGTFVPIAETNIAFLKKVNPSDAAAYEDTDREGENKNVVIHLEPLVTEIWPDETWREPVTGMEFVWVPGGCFQMGSPASETGRGSDEDLCTRYV